jgi:hypothetical protein
MAGPELWAEFERDPRDPRHAHLRAADVDRDLVHRALADAFAEGRLDHEEFDERSGAVVVSKMLGDLPPVLEDLLPAAPLLPVATVASVASPDLKAEAEAYYRNQRRSAWVLVLWLSALMWTIWIFAGGQHEGGNLLTGWDPFPWPFIVMAATSAKAVRLTATRREVVAQRELKLQRRAARDQARAVEQQRRALEGPA